MIREWSIERDDRLLKEFYPETARKIIPYVEAECDRMEYNGSRMYDEIPDKYMMEKISERICGQLSFPEKEEEMIYADDDIFAAGFQKGSEDVVKKDWLKELVGSLLYHEIFSRRCRHNQCKCCRIQ